MDNNILQKIQHGLRDLTSEELPDDASAAPPSETAHGKDGQVHNLTKAYIIAFSIIAAISVFSHFIASHATEKQRENAEVTFTMTNVRAMVDTILSQSSAFKNSGDNFDDELLTQSIERFKKENMRIESYSSSTINGIFHAPPYMLSDKIKKFLDTAESFARYKRTNKSSEAAVIFAKLTGEASKALEINLDLALNQYRNNVIEQIEWSYKLQFAGVVTILLVLVLEAAFIFRPLTRKLGKYHKYLLRLALTDMLTGLNNRRAFMQLANEGLDYYKRHKTPFALVLMDLDHFKSVNDTYGHKVGDLVLQHYAGLLQKSLRMHDTIGRIGGEEFAIFLPRTTAEEAMPMIERFRKRVAETPCTYTSGGGEEKSLNYSSSFGIICVTQGDWTLDGLLILADEQLYKAKEEGRNRVVLKSL